MDSYMECDDDLAVFGVPNDNETYCINMKKEKFSYKK